MNRNAQTALRQRSPGLPGELFVSWVDQRQRNTWIFVVARATLNGLAMIRIVRGIWGQDAEVRRASAAVSSDG